jgi:2-polyprenyl-3-methyl-5-hydroxy-6-metoxy-1,4-benzoquinol methylase
MDVVEHIRDDVSFLRSAAVHARPGGIVVVNVPANQWLYSRYDKELGHERRYSRTTLLQLLRDSGLAPVAVKYWGMSMLPLLMARKLMLSLTSGNTVGRGFEPPGRAVHRALKWVKNMETTLLSAPFSGTSLLAVAQVKAAR